MTSWLNKKTLALSHLKDAFNVSCLEIFFLAFDESLENIKNLFKWQKEFT